MKLHLPYSFRKALLAVLASTMCITSAYGAGMHYQVSYITYTDFGQNMGRYRVSGVNDLLSSIRKKEGGVVITYKEGHDDYTLEHYMPSFESQGDNGAYAAIGYNYIATVQHNGCQNPIFTGRYIGDANSLRYYGVEYNDALDFCMVAQSPDKSATFDYKVTRLNRLVTDVMPSTPIERCDDGDIFSRLLGQMEYRSGSGTKSLWDLDGYRTGMGGAYSYATGGVRIITGGQNNNPTYGFFTTVGNMDYSEAGISESSPLPFAPDGGDSGSPVWIWDEASQSYLYMDAYQSIFGDGERSANARGAINYTWDSLERFDQDVAVNGSTVHIRGVVARDGDEVVTENIVRDGQVHHTYSTTLHKGSVVDAQGNVITDYVGVKGDGDEYINTWLNLAPEKDKATWFAYDNKYYNVGTYDKKQRELEIQNLFFTENLVFQSDSASGNTVVVDADTDLGIGYLQFKRAEGAPEGQAVVYTLQSAANNLGRDYMVNSAGFVVEKGVDLHVKLTNTERVDGDYYYREWRKVGDGDLYLEGQGENGIFLNVGGSGTTYLKESGGFAAYNVYVGSGSTVVMDSTAQIARDFTFGYNGGTLDIRGNNTMDWYRTNTNVAAQGFSINSYSEDSYITNSLKGTTLELTYKQSGNTEYLGSFVDTEDGGAVRIRFDAGEGSTTTLRSIHTDLTHQKGEWATGSAAFVDSGKVVLEGSNTVHGRGSENGLNTNRYSSTEDWHYADMAGDVHVNDFGAEFELGSHARLTGDVYVYTGGILTIREGVHSTYEYIEGGQRLEDTTSEFYRQFYGLHGDIETDLGTEVRFEYSAGTTAEQVYTGNITGGADIYMNLGGSGATLRLSGNNTFSCGLSLSGGGLISDNGLAALGAYEGLRSRWLMAEDSFIAANGATGDELLGMLSSDSQGMLALTQNQTTDLNLQLRGFSNLFVGALAGKTVHYGEAGKALATTLEGGSPKWLLGGGGGNLIVDFLLDNKAAVLVLGNGYTDGTVTLTNARNSIGSITFSERVTLDYTEAAALGGADVTLDYGRRMQLAAAEDVAHVTPGSQGAVLVDKLGGAVPDMRGHAGLYVGSTGSVVLDAAPQIDTGATYRFGGITGTLTVNAELADVEGQPSGLSVDAQGYSGGVLELTKAATLTGDVVVRGYDADLLPAAEQRGDITLNLTCNNALADAASVTLLNGSALNLNGTSQTFHNLAAQAGTAISSADPGSSLTLVNSTQSEIAADMQFDSLVKQGDGRLILSGFNHVDSYDVLEGTLKSATVNSLYRGVVNVHAGATLGLANGTANVSVVVHDGASLEVQHGETAALTKSFTFQGSATVCGTGTLNIGSTTQLGKDGSTFTINDSTVLLTANGSFTQKGILHGEGNATLRILGGDKTHSYQRVLEHLDVADGATLTVQQDQVETNPTYEIHNITGSGELVLSAGGAKDSPSYYRLNRDTDFSGTFTFRAGTGHSAHPYMNYAVIQADNALHNAQVQMYSWNSNTGYITLGVDTENARIQGLSTTNKEFAILMAGGTGSDTVSRPVSTRRATLTITGSDTKVYNGLVVGGAAGTDHGLSIVMDGTGTQTFSGSSVFNDVSALRGTLKITATDDDTAINGDLTVARGASLTIGKEYALDAGKTIHVVGSAADYPASLDAPLALYGGTIEFSGTAMDTRSFALMLDTTLSGRATVSFSDTSYIQSGSTYLLANGDWSGVALTAGGLDYLDVNLNGTLGGLTATFSRKSGNYIWDGDLSNYAWTDTQFGRQTATFTETDSAVFTDAAEFKTVNVACSRDIASLVFDSSDEYTVNANSGTVTASTLRHTGSGTTVVYGGVRADNIQLEAGELEVRDAALLNGASSVSGAGTLSIDIGAETAINLPTIGGDGIGALHLVSGALNASGTLNVIREAFVEERASLTSNTVAFLKGGVPLHLAGNLTLNLSGSTNLNTSITGIDGRVGTLALTGGTVTVNKATALQVGTLDLRQGSMVVHRDGDSVREIGTLQLGNNTTFSQYSDTQPGTAMEIGSLVMTGGTATLKEEYNSGALAIHSLSHSGSGSATLNLTNSATSTIIATFYLGGEDESADDFAGTINLSSTDGGGNRSAAIILNDANVAARAAVNLASAASGGALLGLGVNAGRVEIAGLSSGSDLGNRARVFSGGLGVNTNTSDAALAGDDTVRNLAITTTTGADCVFNGTIGKNLNITVGGEGSQSFNGDNTAFNGTLTLTGGTLALGNSGIGSKSSAGGFNATLAGGTLKLADNTVNLGTGTLVLSGSSTISLDAASTDPAVSHYADGGDRENGYLSLTVLRAAAVEDRGATLAGAGVLQGMEFTVTDTAITARAGASERSYFVNTAVQYGADAPNTAYAEANALVLNADGAVLNMQSGLSAAAEGKGLTAAVAGGTVNLAQGVTLHQNKLTDNQNVKVGGAGTYQIALRQSSENINTYLGVQEHVTLADDWTGTVEVLGAGGDHSHISLQDYGNSLSTVKLTGNSGWLDGGSFDVNLLLEDAGSGSAMIISNGSNNATETFNGSISGSGTLEKVWYRTLNFKFNGDLSNWTGGFKTTGGTANVYLLAGVTNVGASIQATSLTVGASATETANVTFFNTVSAATITAHGSVTVGLNGTLDLTALTSAATLDSLTLASGSTLALNHTGWLTTSGTLAVADGSTLDLTGLSVSSDPQSYVLATGGSVTLGDNVGFTLADESLKERASLGVVGSDLVLTVARGASDLLWRGADGMWTTDASAMNWYFDGTSRETAFVQGDSARFGADSNNRTATLAEDITAGAVAVDGNAAVTVALNNHDLTTGNLAVESDSTLNINGNGRTLEAAAANISGAVSIADGTTLKLNGEEASFSLGKLTLNNGSKLNVAAAASVTAESLLVEDTSGAEISLAQDMDITAGGSADSKAGALYTMGATKTLNIHSADAADIKTLTVDKLDIANSNTGVSLRDVVMNVREAATVGVLITDRSHDVGHMTVGGGAELNFNGSVNWHNSENVVSLTVQDGGAVNVNHGAANTLDNITVNEGGSLSFAADTTTALFGSVTLAEQIANDGTLDFGGRAVAISLADDAATFHVKDAGYTNIDGDEDENGFSHSMMGAVTSGSGNIANGGSVDVTLGGFSFIGLNADGTFGTIDNATYHVRSGEVEYSTLKGSSTITSVALSDNATLNLDAALAGGVRINSSGGTVNIGSGTVLNAGALTATGNTMLTGSGVYAVSYGNATPSLGNNVSLGSDWNGILRLSGGGSGANITLNDLTRYASASGTSYSAVEFDGASGYYQGGGDNTFSMDIMLAADKGNASAMNVSNGNTGATYTFSGKVSGSGTWERSATGPVNLAFTFTGAVSEWTGCFKLSNAKNNTAVTTLNFTGNAPSREDGKVLIAAGVVNAANGKTLNVTVTNGKEVVLTGDFTRTTGTLNLTVDANATFTGTLSDVSTLTIKSGASVQLPATRETPVQHSVGTIAFDGGNAYNRNLLVAEGVKLTAANINNAWGVGTLCVEGEMDVTSLLKFSSGGNGSTLNNIITGGGTINTAALEFSNIGTYNVTDLHELNVSGATTLNTSNTVNVSASTLNLNGTVTTSRGSLNLKDGAVVNINGTSGTNTLQNLSTSASSRLAFAQGTTATISGTGSLAATIVNAGNLTLSGTYSLDGFDISQSGNFTEGQQSGNGFLTGDLSIRLVSGGTVQEGDALVLTYFGKQGTLNTETGCVAFAGAGQPQYDTFYVNKADTVESFANAIQRSSGAMESIRMADGTILAMDRDGATLGHLVLAERASATINVTQSGTINSVEGLGAGQTLTVSGAAGKVLTLNAGNAFAGLLDVQAGTLQLGANLTLAGGLANGGTINLNNKAMTMNGQAGGTSYTMGTLSNGGSSDMTLNSHAEAVFDKDASVRRVVGNAGSALVVGDNATLTLTSTDRNAYYTQVSDLDVRGTLRLKGGNGAIRIAGYEDGQVFNLGHLDIDGASGTTYVLTSGGVNYTTNIVVKSLSGGGANHTLQASDCYTGGSQGQVIDFIIGEAQDHADLYTGKIQYGIGTSSAKAGSGMNLVIKDELVASKAVLDAIFGNTGNAQSATITVDTARAKVKGLTGSGNDARTMQVGGTDAEQNRVLEIVGDGNYTYGGKLGAHLDVVHSGSGTQSFGGVDGFNGSIEVQAGIMQIMNAASVNVQDVTVSNGTLGVYKDGTVAEANEGTLTIKDTKTLTAGKNATLNANLVMESGSTLDVRGTGGAGLLMGSEVTLSKGMTLSDYSSDWASWEIGTTYTLFTGVDGLDIGNGVTTGTMDYTQWVDAKEYFDNIKESNRYFLCYGGAPDQNAQGVLTAVNDGSNVGMVYIMTMPEPTTSTLSLLALAALAARRRRK
ncbi:MAG: hypothetical protein MJ056_00275 [Akkermansia sp.]|nr:hypothetical protein [Akkermansia sp.]